ncbi:MAG: hypothetical protein ABW003_11650 [Microvirga sp.]
MSYDKDWEVHLALNDPHDPIHDYMEQSVQNHMNRITSVVFQDSDRRYGNKEAVATMSDGTTNVYVVCWFSDELTFIPNEFVGLTIKEARDLKQQKDIAYLRS